MKRTRDDSGSTGVWGFIVDTVTSIFAPELSSAPGPDAKRPMRLSFSSSSSSSSSPPPPSSSTPRGDAEGFSFAPPPFSPIARRNVSPLPAPSREPDSGHLPSVLDLLEQEQEMERFEQSVHNLSLSRSGLAAANLSASPRFSTPKMVARQTRQAMSPLSSFYDEAAAQRERSMTLLDIASPEDRGIALNRLRVLTEKFDATLPPELINEHLAWAREQAAKKPATVIRELTEEEEEVYEQAMSRAGGTGRVVTEPYVMNTYDVELTHGDIARLAPGQWLNDETINLYMKMIQRRSADNEQLPRVHCFNSFFYPMLCDQGYQKVSRWTRRSDVFAKDMVLFPVHLGNHWCLGIINFGKKRLEYYDSLKSDNAKCIAAMKEWVEKESLDKKKAPFDWSGWADPVVNGSELPLQMNGSDCGVFAAYFASYFAKGVYPSFSQDDMKLLRRRLVVELVRGQFLD